MTREQGGRKSPVSSRYRPNHNFKREDGEINGTVHEYIGIDKVEMGTSAEALLTFFGPDRQAGRLYPGFEFTVQEGSHIVGHGTVIEVINPLLHRNQS